MYSIIVFIFPLQFFHLYFILKLRNRKGLNVFATIGPHDLFKY